MPAFSPIRRVILTVLDGLRPDAIERFELSNIGRVMEGGASTHTAATVTPSVTSAALTTLMTGVSPARHGINGDRLSIPRSAAGLTPLPERLAAMSYPSSAFLAELPPLLRGVGSRIGRRFGFGSTRFAGRSSADILVAAGAALRTQRRGLIVFHWPDADRAGHADGWMSPAYADGCRQLDRSVGSLVAALDLVNDPTTMLVLLADHGGGGRVATDHESDHPLDRTIPIAFAGAEIEPGRMDDMRLVDVPPTILRALGLDVPASYEGVVQESIFAAAREAALV